MGETIHTIRHIAVIVAAGRGLRMQSEKPKVWLDLAGRPVLAHVVDAFKKCPWIDAVIVVTSEDYREDVSKLGGDIIAVPGGRERADSVCAGLAAAQEWIGNDGQAYVYIHDGARPLISREVLDRVREGVMAAGACVCGMPVKDTTRMVSGDHLAEILQRDCLRAIQTPQAFDLAEITEAYERCLWGDAGLKETATDDAMIYEAATGRRVLIVEGSYANIKLTTPEDMIIAEALMER